MRLKKIPASYTEEGAKKAERLWQVPCLWARAALGARICCVLLSKGSCGGRQGERSKKALWEKVEFERKVSVEENGTLLLCRESTGRAWKLAKLLSYKAPFHRKVVVIQEGPLMKPLSSTHAKGQ